jgi:hypothetical protein
MTTATLPALPPILRISRPTPLTTVWSYLASVSDGDRIVFPCGLRVTVSVRNRMTLALIMAKRGLRGTKRNR